MAVRQPSAATPLLGTMKHKDPSFLGVGFKPSAQARAASRRGRSASDGRIQAAQSRAAATASSSAAERRQPQRPDSAHPLSSDAATPRDSRPNSRAGSACSKPAPDSEAPRGRNTRPEAAAAAARRTRERPQSSAGGGRAVARDDDAGSITVTFHHHASETDEGTGMRWDATRGANSGTGSTQRLDIDKARRLCVCLSAAPKPPPSRCPH